MYAVSITVNGETVWQAGYFPAADDAAGWMERNDAQFESLVVDLSEEYREGQASRWIPTVRPRSDAMGTPEIDVQVVLVNSIVALEKMGWNA